MFDFLKKTKSDSLDPFQLRTTKILDHSLPGIGSAPCDYRIPASLQDFEKEVTVMAKENIEKCDLSPDMADYLKNQVSAKTAMYRFALIKQKVAHKDVIFSIQEEQQTTLNRYRSQLTDLTAALDEINNELNKLEA